MYFITEKSKFKTFQGDPLHFNAWKIYWKCTHLYKNGESLFAFFFFFQYLLLMPFTSLGDHMLNYLNTLTTRNADPQ